MADDAFCACGCGLPLPRYIKGHDRRAFLGHTEEDRGFTTPCWISDATPKGGRYVQIHYNGRRVGAHRVAYELAKGPIPNGFQIDHLCRVTNCIRPEHLEAVEPYENVRRQRGVKLTPTVVREIRASAESGREIARRIGISSSLVSLVRRRKLWANVE